MIYIIWKCCIVCRNPKAPGRDHFLNMDPSNWEQYDIDWPPFTSINSSYLNIGIPPVVSRNYRQQYMNFWSTVFNEQLNGDRKSMQSSTDRSADESTSFVKPLIPHVNYYLDKSTENPIRQLQYLLHNTGINRSDMYATQSTVDTPTKMFETVSASPENTFVLGDNKIIVKADSTLNVLIAMIIIFLVINVIIITIYLVRRNYFKKNLKQKLDILSLDGTTDDDLKRSNKFNDGDESFILDMVRRKNEYVPVKRYHSPINGFLLTRHYSTSTVDTHTKVSDWISHEVNRQSPHLRSKSPSFSFGTTNLLFGKKSDDINADDNITQNGRQPIELMKSKSFELNMNRKTGIIRQELNERTPMFDKAIGSVGQENVAETSACVLQIDHRHTNSDPVAMATTTFAQSPNEKITSFIEDVDVNVTSRDECDGASHFPLTPEETLQIYQMRNYPKVLPKYPNPNSEYISTSSFKRRSMPSYQHMINTYARAPPVPPPRTTSTLDRMVTMRRSDGNRSDPLVPVMVQPIPEAEETETIAIAALHVGPLLPGSKENLYSTVNRKKYNIEERNPCLIAAQIESSTESTAESSLAENPNEIHDNETVVHSQPKSIMKRPFTRQNSGDGNSSAVSQVLSTSSKIPILSRVSASGKSNSSNSSSSNSDGKSGSDPSTDDSATDLIAEMAHSAASITSSVGTNSSAETIKQIF